MKSKILSVILAIIITGPINAQKISEFRPENRTGVSAEKGLLKAWPADGPSLLWSTEDLASRFSQPSSGSDWVNNNTGNWCCINWDTGKKMWEEKWNGKGSIIAANGMLYIYEERL